MNRGNTFMYSRLPRGMQSLFLRGGYNLRMPRSKTGVFDLISNKLARLWINTCYE